MRKASVNFQQVTSISFAISHSERTELHEPGYLLPKQFRHQNAKIDGSWSEDDLKAAFQYRRDKLSRQAKVKGASPFWEGVINLPDVSGFEINDYLDQQSVKLKKWKELYEEKTGMHVLHMVIHLDEGYLDDSGQPIYNPHAHVLVDRISEADNKIIRLGRKTLSEVQDLTAEVMQMERGETPEQRKDENGKVRKGRQHLNAKAYREQVNAHKKQLRKVQNSASEVVEEAQLIVSQLSETMEQEKNQLQERVRELEADAKHNVTAITMFLEQAGKTEKRLYAEMREAPYRELRAWLKGSGKATQADYSALKALHEDPKTTHRIPQLTKLLDQEDGDVLTALREISGITPPQRARQPTDEKSRRQALENLSNYQTLRDWLTEIGATNEDQAALKTLIGMERELTELVEVMREGGDVLAALHEFVPPQPPDGGGSGSGYGYGGP